MIAARTVLVVDDDGSTRVPAAPRLLQVLGQIPAEPAVGFEFIADQNGENTYAAVLRKSDGVKVEFRRKGRYAYIEGYGIEKMRLRAGISPNKECVPIVESVPLPYWYIASQVLDVLFFDDESNRPR